MVENEVWNRESRKRQERRNKNNTGYLHIKDRMLSHRHRVAHNYAN